MKKEERVADCVHRYQSVMLKMRGSPRLARFVRLRCWSRCTRPDERDDARLVIVGDTSRSHQCRCWCALLQSDRTVMLNTAANWATIISAVPVAIAASSAR